MESSGLYREWRKCGFVHGAKYKQDSLIEILGQFSSRHLDKGTGHGRWANIEEYKDEQKNRYMKQEHYFL